MKNKKNHGRAAGADRPLATRQNAARKNKNNAPKPKAWLMVIFWIMSLLMLGFIYMKIRHFFNVHW